MLTLQDSEPPMNQFTEKTMKRRGDGGAMNELYYRVPPVEEPRNVVLAIRLSRIR